MNRPLNQNRTRIEPASESFHFGATVWLLCCLIAAAILIWHALPKAAAPVAAPARLAIANSTPFAKPIEQIRVGERVLAHNPELAASEPRVRELDTANWRLVSLRCVKLDGSEIDIQLLRDVDWLKEVGAAPGEQIDDLELKEFGADGPATVLSIVACPSIARGNGSIVTGTFAHTAKRIIDLHIAGQKPIGCTDNHLFWSADRRQFVPAGELKIGETLSTANNGLMQVAAISPRPQPDRVYNLEVDIEHTYYISDAGVLVHNSCSSNSAQARRLGPGRFAGKDAAHIAPSGNGTKAAAAAADVAEIKRIVDKLRPPGLPPGNFNFGINIAAVDKAIHQSSHTVDFFRQVAARLKYAESGGRLEFIAHEMTEIMADMAMGRLP
jgi:hypothetical protein